MVSEFQKAVYAASTLKVLIAQEVTSKAWPSKVGIGQVSKTSHVRGRVGQRNAVLEKYGHVFVSSVWCGVLGVRVGELISGKECGASLPQNSDEGKTLHEQLI